MRSVSGALQAPDVDTDPLVSPLQGVRPACSNALLSWGRERCPIASQGPF